MIYRTIADIMAANERSRARFITAVSNLTEAQANVFRALGGGWQVSSSR